MAALTHYGLDEAGALSSVSVSGSALSGSATGRIIWHAGTGTPEGTLYCDGSAISRTAYPELFAVIGTTYGAGDGSTTFNIPDLRGLFLRGTEGAAETLGTEQEDAIRNITGSFSIRPTAGQSIYDDYVSSTIDGETESGYVFSVSRAQDMESGENWYPLSYTTVSNRIGWAQYIRFNASRSVPTADENRPVNMAMRPCIIYE